MKVDAIPGVASAWDLVRSWQPVFERVSLQAAADAAGVPLSAWVRSAAMRAARRSIR